ncbi:MAG: response regulator [Pseudomonadota bacterium]
MDASEKSRILFVDDDPNLLEGLKRTLRPHRHEWEMTFAKSAREALSSLAQIPVDVILTDFRMAEMSGLDLLREVKHRYPRVIRILFSGEVDQALIMQSVRVAHQFISKPCSAATLKERIEQTISLREILEDDALRVIVSRIDALPSLPALYGDVLAELKSPTASIKTIGRIIAGDIAMASKILQLVNSAFFGLRQRITSPEQAVLLLGIDIVKSLVLSLQLFTRFNIPKSFFSVIKQLWQHSINAGRLAKLISEKEGLSPENVDHAFMAGLLHDCGKLVFLSNFPEQMKAVLTNSNNSPGSVPELERHTFGVTHAQVGAYLLGLWGLPSAITAAIAFHHTPGGTTERAFSVLAAVYIADQIDLARNLIVGEKPMESNLDMAYLFRIGRADRIPFWCELAREVPTPIN